MAAPRMSRRPAVSFAVFLAAAAIPSVPCRAEPAGPVPWDEVRAQARAYVDRESPPEAWPFERPGEAAPAPAGGPRVFAHYFLPFPLSLDNRPPGADYYAHQYLPPGGENGKHAAGGGFLRERPLTPPRGDSPWWSEIDLAVDVLRARKMGIDGFACDMLQVSPDGQLWKRMERLFDVAAAVAPGFRILPMPDMEAELKTKPELLGEALLRLSAKPSAYRLDDGRMVVAPFNAQRQPPEYWEKLFAGLRDQGVATAFLPVFQAWQRYAEAYAPLSYGFSDWGPRDVDGASKMAAAAAAASRFVPVWMMPVAPQDMRPKASVFHEAGGTQAYRALWGAAIDSRSPLVQLITWNDYSEHTEVSPSSGTQYLFYDLGAYYAAWLKAGRAPRIVRDAIYYCHRSQVTPLAEPPPLQPRLLKRAGATPVRNEVEMVALLTAPATLEIELGGKVSRQEAPAGLSSFSVPAGVGQPVFRIVRDGATRLEARSAWPIVDRADVEDLLYRGGSSTRPFAALDAPAPSPATP